MEENWTLESTADLLYSIRDDIVAAIVALAELKGQGYMSTSFLDSNLPSPLTPNGKWRVLNGMVKRGIFKKERRDRTVHTLDDMFKIQHVYSINPEYRDSVSDCCLFLLYQNHTSKLPLYKLIGIQDQTREKAIQNINNRLDFFRAFQEEATWVEVEQNKLRSSLGITEKNMRLWITHFKELNLIKQQDSMKGNKYRLSRKVRYLTKEKLSGLDYLSERPSYAEIVVQAFSQGRYSLNTPRKVADFKKEFFPSLHYGIVINIVTDLKNGGFLILDSYCGEKKLYLKHKGMILVRDIIDPLDEYFNNNRELVLFDSERMKRKGGALTKYLTSALGRSQYIKHS